MATGLLKANENWIYQSNRLIEASYSLTVMEQKLVRLLASMIKKDDVDFAEYKFRAIDLCEILNVKQNNIYKELDKVTDMLMSRHIKIKNEKTKKFKKRHLINIADFENGVLTLKIDKAMKEFYINLNWYTKYQLKNIMQFKSTYSFRLYELLKQYEKIGEREITINELRVMLDIEQDQYPKYANLKQRVLSIAQREINKMTDIYFEIEEVKTCRKITSIKFIIKSNIKAIDEVCATKEGKSIFKEEKRFKSEINVIKDIFKESISELDAKKILDAAKGDINIINEKYRMAEKVSKINNVVGWVIDAIKRDYQPPKEKRNKGNFNNYDQRTYDYDDLEKKLLGWDNLDDEDTEKEYQQRIIKVE